jgi:hypothetical protein
MAQIALRNKQESCQYCRGTGPGLIRGRRDFKTYSGESIYIYFLVCTDCLSRIEPGAAILDHDGQPLELERSTWHEDQPRPEIAAPVKARQMTIEEALQMKLFEEV